jgi:hypothetical protein
MTSRTIGNSLHGIDVVSFHQLLSFRRLIVTRRRPIHVEDLLARSDVLGRAAMTFQTPVGRTLDFGERPGDSGENEDRAEDTHPGNRVGAAMKNLGHYRS